MKKKVLVAMSGGVDSSVAAVILKNKGYFCVGATMILDSSNKDREFIFEAKNVCRQIGIEHFVFDFSYEFNRDIIDNFVKTYEKGETPNPCILCNKKIKFGMLLEKALSLNFDYIATGHYAKITYCNNVGRFKLKKATNIYKDQSYFLYNLTQHQLKHIIFPLQNIDSKLKVREIARNSGLKVATKKESQDICFVGAKKFKHYIEDKTVNFSPGNFVDLAGNILGQHKGLIYYTVGQRKGLGVSFIKPMFVKKIDPMKNEVVLACEEEIFEKKLMAKDINLIFVERLKEKICLYAKIRYRAKEQKAFVVQKQNYFEIEFENPQRAITKGQAVVLYENDTVVGGGTIC